MTLLPRGERGDMPKDDTLMTDDKETGGGGPAMRYWKGPYFA